MSTDAARVRTVAITGQSGVGKTSVADALVFAAGGNNRLGRVDDESSLFDTEPEEIRRKSTITSALHTLSWDRHDLTLIDTPGQGNFVADAAFVLRGVGAMLLVLDPTSPVAAETLKVWKWARENDVPVLAVVNRLDRPEADLDSFVDQIGSALETTATLIQLPIGSGESLSGVVDLLGGKAFTYDGNGKSTEGDVPSDLSDAAETQAAILTEAAAEGDDELLEKYLEDGELSSEDVAAGLRAAVRSGGMLPVLCASAQSNIGFDRLLNALCEIMPAPADLGEAAAKVEGEDVLVEADPNAPFSAFVFKTIVDPHAGHLSVFRVMSGSVTSDTQVVNTQTDTKERLGHLLKVDGKKTRQVESAGTGDIVAVAKLKGTHSGSTLAAPARPIAFEPFADMNPAITFAIAAKKRGEEDKAAQGLNKLCEEDPALVVERDEGSGEILLSGSGQLHVEVACERLARKYGVEVELKAPKVPYRETIRKGVKAHGRLKKQSGGHGQFADCKIEVAPLAAGEGFSFESKIVGGAIPRGFIPAVEKGVVEAMRSGSIAGCPVVDVKVTLYDGQYHDVDSSEMAFKVAGSMAMREALEDARPCLLEPYVSLAVTVPDECMGDVMGDLNSRRAKVEGMDQVGHSEVIRAKVPMSEVLRYAPDLTSMTSGRGSFEMAFSHYEQLPDHLVDKAVADTKAAAGGA